MSTMVDKHLQMHTLRAKGEEGQRNERCTVH